MFRIIGSTLIFQFIFFLHSSNATKWILQQDLPTEEVTKLNTPEQEHQLLLKYISRKNKADIGMDILLEIFAKVTDGDFYGIVNDENERKEYDAVVKAAFDLLIKVPYQEKVFKLINSAVREASSRFQRHKNVTQAMIVAYSKINSDLQNVTSYHSLKQFYQNVTSSNYKVYHYGIPKTENDLRKIFVELTNHPKMKKIGLYTTFQFQLSREEVVLYQALSQLVNTTGKVDLIQQIFDDTLLELLPKVKEIGVQDVDLKMPLTINLVYLKSEMTEKLIKKIKSHDDLKTSYETLETRLREAWAN
ncbi:hypothetical protein V9T40_000399 [Parthenolecanium corni]|uniref:Uncharacterized protein n=1 Tax=Parthenolecanium corni TaxID=536013 RepID=A0AAN9TBJ0_9HEMI